MIPSISFFFDLTSLSLSLSLSAGAMTGVHSLSLTRFQPVRGNLRTCPSSGHSIYFLIRRCLFRLPSGLTWPSGSSAKPPMAPGGAPAQSYRPAEKGEREIKHTFTTKNKTTNTRTSFFQKEYKKRGLQDIGMIRIREQRDGSSKIKGNPMPRRDEFGWAKSVKRMENWKQTRGTYGKKGLE